MALAESQAPGQRVLKGSSPKSLQTPSRANPTNTAPRLLEGSSYKFAQYYGPPNQTRMRSLLEGAKIQPLPDGRDLVTDAKLQTFSLAGEHELAVQAPQCIADRRQGTVSSPGPLRAQLGDGKFALEGEGFLWRQTNSDLLISNRVRTVLQPELFARPSTNGPAPAAQPIEILSRQFAYETNSGLALYRDNVRVTGANLALTSGILRALVPLSQRHVQSITAEENVSVDYAGYHAAGETAVYSAEMDEVRLSGHPTWRAQQREGTSDELLLERTNGVLHADGHATLRMPGPGPGGAAFLASPSPAPANAPPAPERVLEIRSGNYVVQTNQAMFTNQVQVDQRAGAEIEGTMTCGHLAVSGGGTNQLETMTAQRQVVIRQKGRESRPDAEFSAGKAVYRGTNGLLELTEAPTWRAGLRQGRGDRITVSSKPEQMDVRGNASMRWPAAELTRPGALAVGAPGPSAAAAVSARAAEVVGAAGHARAAAGATNPPFVDISSEQYTVTPDGAVFQNHVRIQHPQMDWTCGKAAVQWSEAGKTARHIRAEETVEFQLADAKGQTLHGTGDQADYVYGVANLATNEVLVLKGNPARLKAERGTIEDDIITLDRTHTRITTTSGKFVIRIQGQPMNTNAFQLPKSKLGKRRPGPRQPTPTP